MAAAAPSGDSPPVGGTVLKFDVIDTGCGIDAEMLPGIFELFRRGGGVTGCGIGLCVCRQLVQQMGGGISAHSSGVPGAGSTFTFTIVCTRSLSGVSPSPASHNPSPGNTLLGSPILGDVGKMQGLRALLAEDNDFNAQILMHFMDEVR